MNNSYRPNFVFLDVNTELDKQKTDLKKHQKSLEDWKVQVRFKFCFNDLRGEDHIFIAQKTSRNYCNDLHLILSACNIKIRKWPNDFNLEPRKRKTTCHRRRLQKYGEDGQQEKCSSKKG